jgi:hypothetical protein
VTGLTVIEREGEEIRVRGMAVGTKWRYPNEGCFYRTMTPTYFPSFLGFHFRASRSASAIWAEVIRELTISL